MQIDLAARDHGAGDGDRSAASGKAADGLEIPDGVKIPLNQLGPCSMPFGREPVALPIWARSASFVAVIGAH